MSARDELEAVVWRRLRRYTTCARADDVVAILDAADLYAHSEHSITTERRTELAVAVGATVHWQHPHRPFRTAACHGRHTSAAVNPDRAKVTCGSCMQSRIWQEAS